MLLNGSGQFKVFDRKDKSAPRKGDKTVNVGGFKYNIKWGQFNMKK